MCMKATPEWCELRDEMKDAKTPGGGKGLKE